MNVELLTRLVSEKSQKSEPLKLNLIGVVELSIYHNGNFYNEKKIQFKNHKFLDVFIYWLLFQIIKVKYFFKFLCTAATFFHEKFSVNLSMASISSLLNLTFIQLAESSILAILLAPGIGSTHGDLCISQANTSEYTEHFLLAAKSFNNLNSSNFLNLEPPPNGLHGKKTKLFCSQYFSTPSRSGFRFHGLCSFCTDTIGSIFLAFSICFTLKFETPTCFIRPSATASLTGSSTDSSGYLELGE